MVVDAITLYVQNFFIQFNSLSQVISENSPLVLLAINVSVKKGYVSIFESIDKSNCFGKTDFYKHLGMYGYRPNVLEKIANEGYYQIVWEGYEWYRNQLLPALDFAAKSPDEYSSLLADFIFASGRCC